MGMIPRIIHQMWAGPAEAPEDLMRTWVEAHPDWDYLLWDDEAIAGFGLKNQKHYDWFSGLGDYSGASDIVRSEVLHRFGGVWADADSRCLVSLDEAPFMDEGFWACEPSSPNPPRMLTSFIGSRPGHPILERWQEEIGSHAPRRPAWQTVGGMALYRALGAELDVQLLPAATFFHITANGRSIPEDGVRYAEHYYHGTDPLWRYQSA
jgi:mannosyltransferase OCH1-like enzyme